MELKEQNVLLFPRTMGLGGTESVVLQICEILKSSVNKVVVCSCGGIHEKELEEMGISHYTIPDIVNKNPKNMVVILKTIKEIVKKESITVVHSHHRMAAFYAQFLGSKIKKIATAHTVFEDKKILTKIAYRGTCVIAVGEKVRENLIDFFGINSKKVYKVYNGIKSFNDDLIQIPEIEEKKKQGEVVIGNVCRLSKEKGVDVFIESIKLVVNQYPNAHFFIIGSGIEEDSLKELSKDLLLENKITFLGYRSDIQNVMSQLNFLVLSSLQEGLPLTPIEAFSVGKTIVATRVAGTPEIVEDNFNGLLIEPNNKEQLSDAILELCKDVEKRVVLEKNATKTYKEKFSFESLSKGYLDFYNNLSL